MTRRNTLAVCGLALLGSVACLPAPGADWPTWRHDPGRTAATDEVLPADLHLQWVRKLPPVKPAWVEDVRLQFDAVYEPIVVGKTMIVASSRTDSVTAYATDSGEQQWKFYANGPVRFAPVAHRGHIYFGCDDGHLYCLDSAGRLKWKLSDIRSDRKVLGNGRIISIWPVRGGPVLADGQIHFTAGVWPFEGVFLYHVDLAAVRGNARPRYRVKSLTNLTPQGYLASADGTVLIPRSRDLVMTADPKRGKTAKLRYGVEKGLADWHVVAKGPWLFHGQSIFHRAQGLTLRQKPYRPVVTDDFAFSAYADKVEAVSLAAKYKEFRDRKGKKVRRLTIYQAWKLATSELPGDRETVPVIDIKAGPRLYGRRGRNVFAIDIPSGGKKARVTWTTQVDGTPGTMLAADGKLFVVTKEGGIHCFGERQIQPRTYAPPVAGRKGAGQARAAAERVLKASGVREGYCLVLGLSTGDLVAALARQSDLEVIGIDPDGGKVDRIRRKLDAAGLYGDRIHLYTGDPLAFGLPPYLANLVVSENVEAAGIARGRDFVRQVFRVLRPYGGMACLKLSSAQHRGFEKEVRQAQLPGSETARTGELTLFKRVGALPGSGQWKHEYSDAANTLMSRDALVKSPLGVLWFGGESSKGEYYYDRHKWPPSMAVVQGRMLYQGPKTLTAVDVYTGRILWQRKLPEGRSPGRRGNFTTSGYHFIGEQDALYLAFPKTCLVLDPATGKTARTFTLHGKNEEWGRIRVHRDKLIVPVFRMVEGKGKLPVELRALDRTTGELIWRAKSSNAFSLVAIAGDQIYCFDGHLLSLYKDKLRKGRIPKSASNMALTALDEKTGKELWRHKTDQVVTWLSFAQDYDVLVASSVQGIAAYQGATGKKLWAKVSQGRGFRGHPESLWDKVILHHDRIIDQRGPGTAHNILSGKPVATPHPITKIKTDWKFTKSGHHCGYAIASEHLLTFRAAWAGYTDLKTGDTAQLYGFRSGCRNSLIPADGVLNAPNFAYGCKCSWSIFTSLALVHLPEVEKWTYSAYRPGRSRVRQVGVNLGAPGDRTAENGTLWLDYPSKLYSSPNARISVSGANTKWFRKHASQLGGTGLKWVAASGGEGIESVRITMDSKAEKDHAYTVRLHFAEPEEIAAGVRVFLVSVQGKPVLTDFDIVKQAGGTRMPVMKEFRGVRIRDALTISLKAAPNSKRPPLLCGIEAIED